MKRQYDDDDGRTIASMEGIEPSGLSALRKYAKERKAAGPKKGPGDVQLSKKESFWYILGAYKAALLIGLAYAVVFGLVIALMLLIWNLSS